MQREFEYIRIEPGLLGMKLIERKVGRGLLGVVHIGGECGLLLFRPRALSLTAAQLREIATFMDSLGEEEWQE